MSQQRFVTKVAAVVAVCACALAGCGSDSESDSAASSATKSSTSVVSASAAQTSASTTTTTSHSGDDGDGVTQQVTTEDFAATITLGSPVARTVDNDPYTRYLTVPFDLTVKSGTLVAPPQAWALRTQSGQVINGPIADSASIGTAIGDGPLRGGKASGVLPFKSSSTSAALDDDVVIVSIELRSVKPNNPIDPDAVIGTWTLPEPVSVKTLMEAK